LANACARACRLGTLSGLLLTGEGALLARRVFLPSCSSWTIKTTATAATALATAVAVVIVVVVAAAAAVAVAAAVAAAAAAAAAAVTTVTSFRAVNGRNELFLGGDSGLGGTLRRRRRGESERAAESRLDAREVGRGLDSGQREAHQHKPSSPPRLCVRAPSQDGRIRCRQAAPSAPNHFPPSRYNSGVTHLGYVSPYVSRTFYCAPWCPSPGRLAVCPRLPVSS
jgi:hypothetical protein